MKFEVGEIAVINEKAISGLPDRVGEVVEIFGAIKSPNYDYQVFLDNDGMVVVKEKELNKVTEEQLQLMTYIKRGNKVIYSPLNEEVEIVKCDFLHGKIEIKFYDSAMQLVGIEALKPLGYVEDIEVELLLEEDQYQETINGHTKEYWLDLFFGHYENEDGNYVVPKDLLHNLLGKLI